MKTRIHTFVLILSLVLADENVKKVNGEDETKENFNNEATREKRANYALWAGAPVPAYAEGSTSSPATPNSLNLGNSLSNGWENSAQGWASPAPYRYGWASPLVYTKAWASPSTYANAWGWPLANTDAWVSPSVYTYAWGSPSYPSGLAKAPVEVYNYPWYLGLKNTAWGKPAYSRGGGYNVASFKGYPWNFGSAEWNGLGVGNVWNGGRVNGVNSWANLNTTNDMFVRNNGLNKDSSTPSGGWTPIINLVSGLNGFASSIASNWNGLAADIATGWREQFSQLAATWNVTRPTPVTSPPPSEQVIRY